MILNREIENQTSSYVTTQHIVFSVTYYLELYTMLYLFTLYLTLKQHMSKSVATTRRNSK